MRRCLVELLACPECQGGIEVAESREENSLRILGGTLRCTSCGQRYPIEKGVPRLVKVAPDVAEVCRRYSFQWLSRWNGRFESSSRCYGFHDDVYIGWVKEQLVTRRTPAPGEWMLDAGCGSGEKTEVLSRLCPEQNVVGVDLGVESLEKAMARFGDHPNLDYVQGNLMEPPFKDRQFDYGMSLGVLHHTPDTRKAFAVFRRLLKEETTLVIWIYPTYWEGPEWRMPYIGRDVICLGQSYRLPPIFLRAIAISMIIPFYPLVEFFFQKGYRRIGRDLPFFRVNQMTWKERWNAQVFYMFDTLLPRYQWRHPIKEVESWFVEEGLDPVAHAHSFYIASSVPVAARTDKLGRETAGAGS